MNDKQQEAFETIRNGNNLFLTGSAGTGKSYTLKFIIDYLKKSNINYGLTALTGCAAVLIGAQTLHSYLGLGIGNLDTKEIYNKMATYPLKLKMIKSLNYLIIDEISMMNIELIEKINDLLKMIKNSPKIFGGLKVIFVGDFCQLPPVEGGFCFQSDIWNELQLKTVVLNEIIRQSEDYDFQIMLEEIRRGICSEKTENILLSLKNTTFDNDIKPTRIYPLNNDVIKINNEEFNKLLKIKKNIKIYKANCNKPKINLNEYDITLIEGAQIMITRNIDVLNGIVNGTRGIIYKLEESTIQIKLKEGNIITVGYYADINNITKITIKFMPIKLAYAISIHKAQGATIDALELDLGKKIFVAGQLYTAISRAKNLKSIKIINFSKESFIICDEVKKFYNL